MHCKNIKPFFDRCINKCKRVGTRIVVYKTSHYFGDNTVVQEGLYTLQKELEDYGSSSHLNLDWQRFDELCDQAKEMEKGQMIEFAQEVFRNRYNQISQSLGNIADDVYNETYKNN